MEICSRTLEVQTNSTELTPRRYLGLTVVRDDVTLGWKFGFILNI